jgi:Putative addiction module component
MLELPEGERLDVVTEVLARLQGEPDPDWEATWLAELDRRELAGPAEPTSDEEWPAVRARILNGLSSRGG